MLKDYRLLTNTTYLWLIQNPTRKVNYSQIAKEVGLSRQTVAKEYKELQGRFDNIYNIKDCHLDELNKTKRAIMIIQDLEKDYFTHEELAMMLGVNRLTISKCQTNYQEKENQPAIYCIKYKGDIIYIGSTTNFESRKLQHLSGIRRKLQDESYIYKYCTDNNITVNDVEISIMVEDFRDKAEMLKIEDSLIKTFLPICNVNKM